MDISAHLQRPVDWLVLTGKRRFVTLVLFVAVVVTLVGLGVVASVEMRQLLSEQNTVQTLFNTLLSGIILLVSIVASINSLVVSQELTPLGNQYERISDSWEFRQQTATRLGSDTSSAHPSVFLGAIVAATRTKLDDLDVPASLSEEAHGDFEAFIDRTNEALDRTESVLDSTTGSFDVALFASAYDPTAYIEEARLLGASDADLPDETEARIEEVMDALRHFATAREYFKTIYYKREFSYLSRDLLYTGLPSIMFVSYVLLAVTSESFAGTTFGVENLALFFGVAYAVALLPFIVLTSYILRAAVIAEHTTASGGFIMDERSHQPLSEARAPAAERSRPDDD
ncbi:hypothetical protein [Candidatus Halobonum tyrrellensis]|uniref:Uncharacterized protein n=1 Tax=Candidatus Halobonum tyrrellensis G22 TaxID=1324957 RepID=V4HN47_9EURY|nr:hypothetical protein [Candidatus Halobonum tyrrellensis]ESP89319.1 hypothetical protein K933_04856 [Candidatus Halobonum tyrrellensis G22]